MAPREEAAWLESSSCSEGHLLRALPLLGTPGASKDIRRDGRGGRFTYNQSWGSKTEPLPPRSPPLPQPLQAWYPSRSKKNTMGWLGSWQVLGVGKLPVFTKGWAAQGLEGTSMLSQGLRFRKA